MGWKSGKGLGKNEDGNTSHIKVTKKNDNKGVGFVGSDDNWIAHQDDFNSLLSSLNGQTENEQIHIHNKSKLNALNKKLEVPKIRNLYKKFLKGKDMSNYSLKDIDAIFGNKKKFRSKISKEKSQLLNDSLHENNSLQNCYDSKKNIQEYFTEKMENKIQKRKKNSVIILKDNIIESSTSSSDNDGDINNFRICINDQTEEKKLKSIFQENNFSEQNCNANLTIAHCMDLNDENKHLSNDYTVMHSKHKKCKSSKKELCNITSKIKKKGKKRKRNYYFEEKNIENNDGTPAVKYEESDESLYKLRNKNKKRKIEEENCHHIEYTKNRYKVLQEVSMFSDTFPNSNTLSILEKYEKLQEKMKNSAIGTSNIFSLSGYGNISSLS